jgi:hypothetical protein
MCNCKNKPTDREKMVTTIIRLASDEIETINDCMKYAKMSDSELIDVIINIAEYYHDNANYKD